MLPLPPDPLAPAAATRGGSRDRDGERPLAGATGLSVRSFDNPTLTGDELAAGRRAASTKVEGPPYRVVFAGRLEEPKGAHVAVDAVLELRRRGVDVELDLVGDGPLRSWVEDRIAVDGSGAVRLQGWVTRPELERFLARGHAFLLPTTSSEGFPKVLGERSMGLARPGDVERPGASWTESLGET